MNRRCRAARADSWARAIREDRWAPDRARPIRKERDSTWFFELCTWLSKYKVLKTKYSLEFVMSVDKDLVSVQKARDLVEAGHRAQAQVAEFDQAKIDRICEAMEIGRA